jgi:2-polyprenyl-6-methoxyphenol hydroxylase-like FAD-dependent oxidoreductase
MKATKFDILGGGPAGLYTAILIKRLIPGAHVRVTEQNPQGATWGFGVVFSDQALDFLKADDPETHDLIVSEMERWENMALSLPGGKVTLDGIGFTAIGRLHLIEILRQRALDLGAELRFSHQVTSLNELDGDLIIGADGLNSLVRNSDPEAFGTKLDYLSNHFAWFGADRPFDALTQTFVETDKGALNAHHYRFSADTSTFIVECTDEVFRKWGFEALGEAESARVCGEIFADALDGAKLIINRSVWRQFPRLWCETWYSGNKVILGDACHTAHFSVGSGTRLAMEDAIALVRALVEEENTAAALDRYQNERPPIAKKIVTAANTSAAWYENFDEKMSKPPVDFAFDYVTRSGRVDLERLRSLSPKFMAAYDAAHPAVTK